MEFFFGQYLLLRGSFAFIHLVTLIVIISILTDKIQEPTFLIVIGKKAENMEGDSLPI